jgi:hypothetical protein
MRFRQAGQVTTTGDEYATWDAAYVLGALSNAERHEYEAHLGTCASCGRAVGELAGMPGLLAQLSVEDVQELADDDAELAPRAGMLDALLDTVQRRRRTRLLAWTGSCAAAAVLAVGLVLWLRPDSAVPVAIPQAAATTVTMAPVQASPLTATAHLVSHSWGTGVELTCSYGAEPPGVPEEADADRLAMVAVGRDGSRAELATWVARPGNVASLAGSLALPIDQIASVQVISTDDGAVLLQGNP